MAIDAALFSSQSDSWETPPTLFAQVAAEFPFTLDVCATPATAKCPRYFTPEMDGLRQPWAPAVAWMNPPYSDVAHWIEKAAIEARWGATVVALVPARTDTRWWHRHIYDATRWRCRPGVSVRFLPGRIRFVGASNGAPFPSCLIVFKHEGEPNQNEAVGEAVP